MGIYFDRVWLFEPNFSRKYLKPIMACDLGMQKKTLSVDYFKTNDKYNL